MQVILLAAQSLDGCITEPGQAGVGFASAADQEFFYTTLATCDARIMGRVTYEVVRDAIRSNLTPERRRYVYTRDPAVFVGDAVPGSLDFTNADPKMLHAELLALGIRRCALLGGSQINRLFLAAGLVDELWLTLEPRIFGGGVRLVDQPVGATLTLSSVENLAPSTLLLKYRVPR